MGVSPVPKATFVKGVHVNGVVCGGSLVWYMMRWCEPGARFTSTPWMTKSSVLPRGTTMHWVISWAGATGIGPMETCGLFVDDDPPLPLEEHATRPPTAKRTILRILFS
jgi:hypothetical protein